MIATKTIPLMVPYIPREAKEGVADSLDSRWIGEGPKVKRAEQRFSRQIVEGKDCVAVGSCTDALHLAYMLAGIELGDEVIAPLFTCTATNIPLLYGELKAKIRFCDVAPNSLNMDPDQCRSLVNERTKAIVVVHYGGMPVRGGNKIFNLLGPMVIEDCAQALGSGAVARFGLFSCFSFQAVKHIGTGDGGMLVLPGGIAEKARRMRWFGIDREAKLNGTWANDITEVGRKYQMNDGCAAMVLAGLDHLDAQITFRRAMRDAYVSNLSGVDDIQVLDQDPESACWLCTVLVERREDFKRKLLAEGIESDQVHYRNDRYTIFKDFRGEFPNMDAIDGKYLCIPLHMGMDLADVERICDVIRSGW